MAVSVHPTEGPDGVPRAPAPLSPSEIARMWRRRRLADLPTRALHPFSVAAAKSTQAALRGFRFSTWEPDGSVLVTTHRLDERSLVGLLVDHDVCAIRVPRFCPADVARRLAEMARGEHVRWRLRGGVATDMFYAAGSIPTEVAQRDRDAFVRYFGERDSFVEAQRVASGGRWPVDSLVEELDRAWPAGACVTKLGGQLARPAIMRAMGPPSGRDLPANGYAHVDGPPPRPSLGNGSANIYLDVPGTGGELLVWNIHLERSSGVRRRLQRAYMQALLATAFDERAQESLLAQLPPPIRIRPEIGDLILLHTGRPHAVVPIREGLRANLQSFLYMRGLAAPVEVFC